jgi:hypothetical protein
VGPGPSRIFGNLSRFLIRSLALTHGRASVRISTSSIFTVRFAYAILFYKCQYFSDKSVVQDFIFKDWLYFYTVDEAEF